MKRFMALAGLALVASVSMSDQGVAQTLQEVGPPAEFPPPDYEGRQFVDSRGCVYVRAGFDGNVTWVPRVTRDRKALCGHTPTVIDRTAADAAPVVPDPEGRVAPAGDQASSPPAATP